MILNEEFNLIHAVDEDLFNPDFPLHFSSEIKLFNIDYKMFQYNSNIAILQLKDKIRMFIFLINQVILLLILFKKITD